MDSIDQSTALNWLLGMNGFLSFYLLKQEVTITYSRRTTANVLSVLAMTAYVASMVSLWFNTSAILHLHFDILADTITLIFFFQTLFVLFYNFHLWMIVKTLYSQYTKVHAVNAIVAMTAPLLYLIETGFLASCGSSAVCMQTLGTGVGYLGAFALFFFAFFNSVGLCALLLRLYTSTGHSWTGLLQHSVVWESLAAIVMMIASSIGNVAKTVNPNLSAAIFWDSSLKYAGYLLLFQSFYHFTRVDLAGLLSKNSAAIRHGTSYVESTDKTAIRHGTSPVV
jgi:hypothetical protein